MESCYFLLDDKNVTKNSLLIKQRKSRKHVLNLSEAVEFSAGDIIVVVF